MIGNVSLVIRSANFHGDVWGGFDFSTQKLAPKMSAISH